MFDCLTGLTQESHGINIIWHIPQHNTIFHDILGLSHDKQKIVHDIYDSFLDINGISHDKHWIFL